jgi:DNA-binding transcriptional LysR family regulator
LETADLLLLIAVAQMGSIGAAAESTGVTQPSASSRLARLERRLGVRLFDRSTTGARPTPAGEALAERAQRAIDVVRAGVAEARSSAGRPRVTVGTIATLATPVFVVLDQLLSSEASLIQRTDHGRPLIEAVVDGALDGAIVGLPQRTVSTRGTRVLPLGVDRLVLFTPTRSSATEPGSTSIKNRQVILHSYAGNADESALRLTRLGAAVRVAASAQTALAMARRSSHSAIVPASTAYAERRDGEKVSPAPFHVTIPVSLVLAGVPSTAAHLLESTAEELSAMLRGHEPESS